MYPELKSFLDTKFQTANLTPPIFNQQSIVSRCIRRFVNNGYVDPDSMLAACEDINYDDFNLISAGVPEEAVNFIYETILNMRQVYTIIVLNPRCYYRQCLCRVKWSVHQPFLS